MLTNDKEFKMFPPAKVEFKFFSLFLDILKVKKNDFGSN